MNETIANRLDRTQYTLKDALDEIALAEAILDGSGATEGLTLWGRIAALRQRIAELEGENERLRSVKIAARDYHAVSSYDTTADGSCYYCHATAGFDLDDHYQGCEYRKAREVLAAELARAALER